jgi:hypothetical protein
VLVACAMSEALFDEGAYDAAFVAYDAAVGYLHECKTPLAFLAGFIQVEWLRITYVQGDDDDF